MGRSSEFFSRATQHFSGACIIPAAGCCILFASAAFAGTGYAPHAMNFNGYLTSAGGSAETGTYDMRFILYEAGSAAWAAEYQTVTVTDGQFSVVLGGTAQGGEGIDPTTVTNPTPTYNAADLPIAPSLLSSVDSSTAVTLQLEVWDGASYDVLSPQFTISSALFALQAETAQTATTAQQIQGVAVSTTAPTGSQILQYNGSQWAPATLSTGSLSGNYVSTITLGTHLSFSSGSGTGTGSTPTVAVDATSADTASTIVARDASGNFTASYITASDYYFSSDRRLKENIKTLNGLDLIRALRGVSFNWKKDGKPDVGVIAQEVEKVLPELVRTDPHTGYKSVEYGNLVGPLIEANKELYSRWSTDHQALQRANSRIESDEKRIHELEIDMNKLMKQAH